MHLAPETFPGVMVAVGEAARGIDGFCETHLQATSARRVATLTHRDPGRVTRFARVELQAMVSGELDLVRALVMRELGPLAAGDDTTLRLAATLRAYPSRNRSPNSWRPATKARCT